MRTSVRYPRCRVLNAVAILVTALFLPNSAKSQGSWSEISLPTSVPPLPIISFSDSVHGCICGRDGVFLYTSDNGNSWSVDTIPSPYPIVTCELVSDSVAWAFGLGGMPFNYAYAVFRSTNSGQDWLRTNTPDSVSGLAAAFVSESVGYFVAQPQPYGTANLWATTNGGDSWAERGIISSFSFPNATLAFFDDSICYVGLEVTLAGPLMKTTDGGLTWTWSGPFPPHPFPGSWVEWCRPARFLNGRIGTLSYWMMDEASTQRASGLILSWDRFQDTVVFAVGGYSLPSKGFALDRSHIWVLMGNLRRTTNGGATWVIETFPVSEILYDLYGHRFALGSGLFRLDTELEVDPEEMYPRAYTLEQNYPNPFNPSTKIGFQIADYGLVTLKVYDLLGREVEILVNELKQPGTYTVQWDARLRSANSNGQAVNVGSGVYFYRLQAGDFVQTRKLLLLQ